MFPKISFSLFFLALICFNIFGQTLEWQKHFSLNNNAIGNKLALENNSYIYAVGNSGNDLLILKYNSLGGLIWTKTYNPGGTNCSAHDIIFRNNYLYICGYTSLNTIRSLTTIKCDTSGNIIWIKFFQGVNNSYYDQAFIALDSSQKIISAGSIATGGNKLDIVTVKYDNTGNQLWYSIIDGPAHMDDYPRGLLLDSLGNIYETSTATKIYNYYGNSYEFLTVKYNPSGQINWEKHYSSELSIRTDARAITLDDSLNTIVSGSLNADYCTIKYDFNGLTKWVRTYSSTGNNEDKAFSVSIDNDCNIYITGLLNNTSPPGKMGTLKYNSSGTQIWDKVFSSSNSVWGEKIKVIENDGIYVLGTILGTSSEDILIYKYNTVGNTIFTLTYNYTIESANDFIIDRFGNIYVVGENAHPGQPYSDLLLLKYSQTIGIQPTSTVIPDKFSIFQNYPNPFNPATKIRFDIPLSSNILIKVYDVLGKELSTIVNEILKVGTYETSWDASIYPSGIYFYKLISENFTETKKMVLIK